MNGRGFDSRRVHHLMMDSTSYIARPEDSTTLLLSYSWMPINITTAKEGLRKLVSAGSRDKRDPTIKVLSGSGEPLCWESWIDGGESTYYSNQPFLRTASRLYPVPTIILTSSNWGYKTKDKPNIKYLYSRFNGVCQICGESGSLKSMSIEHILPKSLHGTDDGYNITITCKKCNSRKSNIYPYKDFKNRELTAPKPLPFFHTFLKERPEWGPFLFKLCKK